MILRGSYEWNAAGWLSSIPAPWQGGNFSSLSISFIGPENNCSRSLIPSSQFYGSGGKHLSLCSVIMCTLYIIKKGFYFNFALKWSVLKLQLQCFMDSAEFNDFLSWLARSFDSGSAVRNLWEGWYFTCKLFAFALCIRGGFSSKDKPRPFHISLRLLWYC